MIPGYIIRPLVEHFSNDEMLLLSVSDTRSLSVSLVTGLIIQASLGTSLRGDLLIKVKWTGYLSIPSLSHPFLNITLGNLSVRWQYGPHWSLGMRCGTEGNLYISVALHRCV